MRPADRRTESIFGGQPGDRRGANRCDGGRKAIRACFGVPGITALRRSSSPCAATRWIRPRRPIAVRCDFRNFAFLRSELAKCLTGRCNRGRCIGKRIRTLYETCVSVMIRPSELRGRHRSGSASAVEVHLAPRRHPGVSVYLIMCWGRTPSSPRSFHCGNNNYFRTCAKLQSFYAAAVGNVYGIASGQIRNNSPRR